MSVGLAAPQIAPDHRCTDGSLSSRPVELLVQTSLIGGLSVLDITGEIDLATLPQLHNALSRAFGGASAPDLVVDLDGVYACDDAALGVLLGAAGRARGAGGDLRVVCSDGPLRSRLERTGFDRAVTVVGSIAALLLATGATGSNDNPGD